MEIKKSVLGFPARADCHVWWPLTGAHAKLYGMSKSSYGVPMTKARALSSQVKGNLSLPKGFHARFWIGTGAALFSECDADPFSHSACRIGINKT
jgi:hypothetical protein